MRARRGRRRTVPAALALVLVSMLGSCAAPAPSTLPDGVTVEVLQGRTDYTSNTIVLRVVNGSDAELALDRAQLDSDAFEKPAIWSKGSTVRVGGTVDLRMPTPPLECGDEDETTTATLSYTAAGARSEATVGADDPLDTIARLRTQSCTGVLVDELVTITPAPELVVTGDGAGSIAELGLSFAPTGAAGTVYVDSISATTLLQPADDAGDSRWPLGLTMGATSEPISVTLRIVPSRCDPHAIADDKVGTILPIAVELGSDEATYRLALGENLKRQFYAFIEAAC